MLLLYLLNELTVHIWGDDLSRGSEVTVQGGAGAQARPVPHRADLLPLQCQRQLSGRVIILGPAFNLCKYFGY